MKYLHLTLICVILCSLAPQFGYSTGTTATLENGVWHTNVGKQVQITTDVTNSQARQQSFAYVVQIQNQDGVVYSLSWITGVLDSGQYLTPSQSWIPTSPGTYTAQIFVWTAIDDPDALSPPVTMKIIVT